MEPRKTALVVNFGVPRSGTTYVHKMLMEGVGYATVKIHEGWAIHPKNSASGIQHLFNLFHYQYPETNANFVVVRTVRHPVEVLKSYFAVHPDQMHLIVGAVRSESENWSSLLANFETAWHDQIVEIRFDALSCTEYRHGKIADLASLLPSSVRNESLMRQFVDETWRTKPVREGRLSMGDDTPLMAPEMLERYTEELADVIEAEGF